MLPSCRIFKVPSTRQIWLTSLAESLNIESVNLHHPWYFASSPGLRNTTLFYRMKSAIPGLTQIADETGQTHLAPLTVIVLLSNAHVAMIQDATEVATYCPVPAGLLGGL